MMSTDRPPPDDVYGLHDTALASECRAANATDIPAIRRLHAASLRRLGRGHYDAAIVERVIEGGTFQPELLRGGRYKVVLSGDRLVGCGGWLEAGPAAPASITPADKPMRTSGGSALVRAVYVDPDFARQGVGRMLMASIEAEARAAGKDRATLMSTVMAVRFFSRLGYAVERPLTLAVAGGGSVEVFAMAKALPVTGLPDSAPEWLAAPASAEPPPHLARAA